MMNLIPARIKHSHNARPSRTCGAILALIALPLAFTAGCGDEVSKEFREAALGSIETGMNAVVDGLLDGFFAVAEPDSTSTDSGTATGS